MWTFSALVLGIVLGGFFPETFEIIASGTTAVIQFFIKLVPLLIFAALSPACATLVKRGLAGKFAASVITWFVLSSALAGMIGLVVSALIFRIPVSGDEIGVWSEAIRMFRVLGEGEGGASYPLLAIVFSIVIGVIAVWVKPLFALLSKIEKSVGAMGQGLGYFLIPILFCLGITIGFKFGPRIGMGHFLTVVLYTFILCSLWSLFYILAVTKFFTKISLRKLVTVYFLPTTVFAMGTISSLVTLPINLTNIKKLGVRDEVADFVIPFGAVTNMDGSALMNIAFVPILLCSVFGLEISWTVMLIVWPAVVIFTIAAPGLPAGMGSSMWTATLIAAMLGFDETLTTSFITTFVAFYGGIPDMFVTTSNCTGDGLTAVVFDNRFDRFINA
ncbi:cation:dicarboxylate symporter family transporter [candidate division KSB1 bacterium]